VFVLGFAEVECELVVDSEVVETTLLDGVSKVVILGITLFTVVPSYTFSGAVAVPTSVVTESTLLVTLTLAALTPIYRVSKKSLTAPLAMITLCVVFTRLLADTWGGTDRVTIALAERAGGEVPLLLCSRAGRTVGPGPGASAWGWAGRLLLFVFVVD